MNKKLKILLIALAAVIVLVVGAVIIAAVARSGQDVPAESETPAPETAEPSAGNTVMPASTPTPEHVNTISSTLAVGGDIVMHTGLNAEAQTADGYDYTPIFGILGQYISGADYAVCSLVTTLSGSGPYTAYPLFKSPASLASSIAGVGFDLVNTGTSHAVDSYKDGIDATLGALESAGLSHVGTYSSEEARAAGNYTVADVGGVSVAFLSYTCDTNDIPVAGFEYAVSICTADYLGDGLDVDYELMQSDLAAARGWDVAVRDLAGTYAKLDLQGPASVRVMKKVLADPDAVFAKMPYFSFKGDIELDRSDVRLDDGTPIFLSRTGYTGEQGFEIFVPYDRVVDIWNRLLR